MKRIILIISLSLLSLTSLAQETKELSTNFTSNHATLNEFKERYRDTDNITIIEIASSMTRMMATKLFEAGNDNSAQLMRSIESIDIVAENCIGESLIRGEMFELPEKCKNYKLISSIDKNGELTKFYFALHPNSKSREFLMLQRNAEQRTVLYITGSFSISDISALSTLSEGMSKKE